MNKIVLASSSPRRKEILSIFGIPFEINSANIKEKIHDGETPEQIAMALAFQKAAIVAKRYAKNTIIIAADTVVVKNRILGKPQNFEDAYAMLKLLQDDTHFVITGIAVIQANTLNKCVDYNKTKVKIKKLTDDLIKKYINTNEVWDKAGSYAIQGKGASIVEWIEGDYFNVVGLPICKLQNILSKQFHIALF